MTKVFECKMTKTITVNIKADSTEEAQFWLQTHDFKDIEKETATYDVDYSEEITGEVNEECAIDISEEE